jgi:hypothetical protein
VPGEGAASLRPLLESKTNMRKESKKERSRPIKTQHLHLYRNMSYPACLPRYIVGPATSPRLAGTSSDPEFQQKKQKKNTIQTQGCPS